MGVHQLFSDVEEAVKLVGRELFSPEPAPAVAGELGAGAARCTKSPGCELAPEHPNGCQLVGHLAPDAVKRCTVVDSVPNLRPGWICCQCATYNDQSRTQCKQCPHAPCMPKGAP
jgi:hypothetical protein